MEKMRNRVHRIASDLNALREEIQSVRKPNVREQLEAVFPPHLIAELRSSVGAMWGLLEEGSLPVQTTTGSFIEKVDAIIQRKMPGHKKD